MNLTCTIKISCCPPPTIGHLMEFHFEFNGSGWLRTWHTDKPMFQEALAEAPKVFPIVLKEAWEYLSK